MDKTDIQLYTVINDKLHEVSVLTVDKLNWSALVTAKYTKPFNGWDGWEEVYRNLPTGWVSLSSLLFFDFESRSLRVIPIEDQRRMSLGSPFVHANSLQQIESV